MCRNTPPALALCLVEFAPGTFTVQTGTTEHDSYAIERRGRIVASGTLTLRRGRVTRSLVGGLRHTRYTLIVRTRRGRRTKVVLRQTFNVR